MKSENKEVLAGILLVLLLVVSLFFVHVKGVMEKKDTAFVLYAPFNKSDGLMIGADVRIAGIKVGRVIEQTLNKNYQVVVKMEFFKPISLPIDSSVVIETDGLLGSKYLEIVPGADEEVCKSKEELEYTQDALVLTDLMEKVNAYMREKNKKEKELLNQKDDVEKKEDKAIESEVIE